MSVSPTFLLFIKSISKSEPSIDMDARASYSSNIANYCRQAITNIQHPQPKSHPLKIPEVVENLEQVAQNFKRQIDQKNRTRMFTDNLHAQCRFDTTRQVLAKMREHRKILEKKDEEIRIQNELIKRLQDQSVNQQIALDNMKIGVSADRQIRIQQSQEIARLKQELAQKDRLIRQQEFMVKNLYKNCQIAEKQVHDLQKASQEPRNLFTRPREVDHVLNVVAQTANAINSLVDQSTSMKPFEDHGSAERVFFMAQDDNHRQVEETNVLVKKVEDLDIKWIDCKEEMRQGENQVGNLWLELRGKIEASSEDPNKITDSSNGEPTAASQPGMLETKTTTPEVEDTKVEICMVKDEDLYSAD
jgi:Txe/YoeB family toxin of Txe-Axe toxin-antitoxin module